MIRSKNRKNLDSVSLLLPIFFEGQIPDKIILSAEEVVNGQALYGDSSKRLGLSDASVYAKKNLLGFRVVEMKIVFRQEIEFVSRLGREDIESGVVDFLRMDKAKKPFLAEIEDMIEEAGLEAHPDIIKNKTSMEWLNLEPGLGRRVFDEFACVNAFVVSTVPHYSGRVLSVALLRSADIISSLSVLFNDRLPVEIRGERTVTTA